MVKVFELPAEAVTKPTEDFAEPTTLTKPLEEVIESSQTTAKPLSKSFKKREVELKTRARPAVMAR
jgi:hypothetical protein